MSMPQHLQELLFSSFENPTQSMSFFESLFLHPVLEDAKRLSRLQSKTAKH